MLADNSRVVMDCTHRLYPSFRAVAKLDLNTLAITARIFNENRPDDTICEQTWDTIEEAADSIDAFMVESHRYIERLIASN